MKKISCLKRWFPSFCDTIASDPVYSQNATMARWRADHVGAVCTGEVGRNHMDRTFAIGSRWTANMLSQSHRPDEGYSRLRPCGRHSVLTSDLISWLDDRTAGGAQGSGGSHHADGSAPLPSAARPRRTPPGCPVPEHLSTLGCLRHAMARLDGERSCAPPLLAHTR